MNSIAQDAQRVSLLFEYGILKFGAVISWADATIAGMESPPQLLLELSMTAPERTDNILSSLHGLSEGADFWAAFRNVVPELRAFVASHPEIAEKIANQMYLTACMVGNLPEDLRFLYYFEDAFSLARQETYGDIGAVYQDFLQEMGQVAKTV